jgi:hypothetical protein
MRKDEQFVALKPDAETVFFVRWESIVRVKTQSDPETMQSAEVVLVTGEHISLPQEEASYLRELLLSFSREEPTAPEAAASEGPAR